MRERPLPQAASMSRREREERMKLIYAIEVKQFKKPAAPYMSPVLSESFYVAAPSLRSAESKALKAYRRNGRMNKNFRYYDAPEVVDAKLLGEIVS